MTDITIGPMKFWELTTFLLCPFLIRYINKQIFYLVIVFSLIFVISLITTYFSVDNFDYFSPLKSKYIISISRYIELLLCCLISSFSFNNLVKAGFLNAVNSFLNKNTYICFLILCIYFLDIVLGTDYVSYGSLHRLKGFYVEGGPFGLYISTLLLLTLFWSANRKKHLYIFSLILLFSQSKAGFVFVFIGLIFYCLCNSRLMSSFLNIKNKLRFIIFAISITSCILLTTYYVGENYLNSINEIDELLKTNANDTSLVMGRIAAGFIGQKMVWLNPVWGIGLGNYSLVRNNYYYRGNFPIVSDWDLTGLGGLYNLLIENGIIGTFIFLLWFIKVFKFSNTHIVFILLFMGTFIFGAQLYMVYPWVYLSFYFLWRKNEDRLR